MTDTPNWTEVKEAIGRLEKDAALAAHPSSVVVTRKMDLSTVLSALKGMMPRKIEAYPDEGEAMCLIGYNDESTSLGWMEEIEDYDDAVAWYIPLSALPLPDDGETQ